MSTGLLMLLTLAFYFLLLLFISRKSSSSHDNNAFFRANRRSPWWMVAFGMIGASISGVSFISVPGWVGATQMTYLQMCAGFFFGYVAVAFLLLPLYYRLQLTSIYTYLGALGKTPTERGHSSFSLANSPVQPRDSTSWYSCSSSSLPNRSASPIRSPLSSHCCSSGSTRAAAASRPLCAPMPCKRSVCSSPSVASCGQ